MLELIEGNRHTSSEHMHTVAIPRGEKHSRFSLNLEKNYRVNVNYLFYLLLMTYVHTLVVDIRLQVVIRHLIFCVY